MNSLQVKEKIFSNEYKICKKRGRSKIWDCFGFIKNENDIELKNFIACKICKNVYKYSANSQSNLNKHKCFKLLRNNNECELIELNQDKKACTDVQTEWMITDTRPYSLVEDEVLKTCSKITLSNNSQSNLNIHKGFDLLGNNNDSELIELNQEYKKACTDVLTEWIIKDIRPYSLLQDDGLKAYTKLVLSFGNKFGANVNLESLITHPTAIERHVKQSFVMNFETLKSDILCVQKIGYALTCNLWTENFSKISYIALTAHFIMDSEYKSKLLGVKSMKGSSNTSSNIKCKLETLLSDFNCSLNDPTFIVTDRESNIKPALKDYANINCINHLIHNAVEKCYKSSKIISKIVATSSHLVKFIKKTGVDCSLNTSLKSFMPTRWNNVYLTLVFIKSNFARIQNIITERNLTEKYSVIKEYHLDQIIAILKPFMDALNELEGSSYVTIHLVQPHIRNLKTICNSALNDEALFITEFKKNLHDTLISLVDSNITIYHKLAIFLFPPANQLIQFNKQERTEIINKCKSLLVPYSNDKNIADPHPEANPSKIYSLFENYIKPIEKTTSNQSVIENEISKYKNADVPLQSDFNVLKWWHGRKNEFPLLYKLSCRIFAIPASSAPSEKVFSVARALITDNRSKLGCNEKSFNDILFVNFNAKD